MVIPFNGSDRTRSVVECDDPAGGRYGLHTPSRRAVPIGTARARMILVIWASLLLRIVWGVLGGVIAMRNAPKVRPSSTRGLIYFKVDIIYIIRRNYAAAVSGTVSGRPSGGPDPRDFPIPPSAQSSRYVC